MRRLVDCLGKVTGKLISKADADQLVMDTRALVEEGLTPIAAEQQAVSDALKTAVAQGEDVLRQIGTQRPQVYEQANEFWNRETIRKTRGAAPPPLPRFVTEGVTEGPLAAMVPADEIVAVHNAEGSTGSTVNAVHGNLGGTNSYSFSVFPDLTTTIPGKNITAEQINKFAAKAQDAGIDTGSPNMTIGTWYDTETDTTFLDIAFTTTDRAEAIALGTQFNQKAIFSLSNYEEIPIGGTGIAPENLPSVAERLGILFPSGDVTPYAETAPAQGAPSARGAPAPAQEALAGRAEGGLPEVGGVHEEVPRGEPVIPPEIPAGPVSDAAQAVVNNLPEEQRSVAQKAFGRDDRDPLADNQRSNGRPVSKRTSSKPIAPEKNTQLVGDLSRLGVFDKTPTEVLSNIAGDSKQPRWIRLLADLFVQLGLGDNVSIRAVNTPEATWPALYVFNRETGKAEVLINLSHKGPDLARRLLHELMHHGTLIKLEAAESDLTPAELNAKRELQKIFDSIRDRPEFKGLYGASRLQEFVSEIFANDELRRKLNSIRPDGKVSVLQRITDAILRMLIGDRNQIGMRSGSLLEAAIKEAINVAGSPRVETSPRSTAAMQERRSRSARFANAFPNLQEEISNLVAPMADNMGISKTDQIERELDHEAAFYSDTERKAVEADVDTLAKKIDATTSEIKSIKERIGAYIKYYRAKHPTKAGWANSEIKPVGLDEKKGLKRGKVNKANPSGLTFKVKFKDSPYTFARDKGGELIPRFLDRKGTVANPEWAKRRAELGDKMFDDLQDIMARRSEGGEKGRVAQVILDQINWYRDMNAHLRTTFGSMSDYVADVIAGFSPITDVPGNWANMIEYFERVMKGHYDAIYEKFDKYIAEDPENRSATTWKKKYPPKNFPEMFPMKFGDEKLFGANTANAMMAGLDLWRAVKTGTAPKARNFGLNLLGLSLRATIDRWAARYLQRMHAPTWRLPPMIEGAAQGAHMPGENVELVSGDFGMGQDVFEDVAKRLQESGISEFENVTPADLQAILWFAEKEIWEMRKWTQIMGAGSSMNALAQATAAQRYESGTMPGKVTAQEKQLMGETIGLRDKINKESHVLGAKMVPSANIHDGVESKTFDGEWITHPEYDPDNTVGHVAEAAARLGKDAAHISRVIVNPYEINDNVTPGLHVFFRGRVGDAEINSVLTTFKKAGITDGISLAVDPRVRPEIIKSLDPETGANQYNGVRVQYVYGTTGKMTRSQTAEAFGDVSIALAKNASIAESRVLHYDTLVLEKGTDYDTSGKLTEHFSNSRKKAWVERARSEGSAAATRRDDIKKANADRERSDRELERRIKREEEERVAAYEAFQRSQPAPDRANDGGVDPPVVAAMQYEDQQQPVRDPHGGRASLVRSMVNALTGASRDTGGIEVPQSQQEVRGLADLGGGATKGRKGSAPLWRPLGTTFRSREASLYQRVDAAAALIRTANPEDAENPKDPAKYENSQKLLDYLSGKQEPTDPELKTAITELRKEIPTIPAKQFESRHLDSGAEADVFHDVESGIVHKLFDVKGGKLSGYVPGEIRLDRGGGVRISMGPTATVSDLFTRMERANTHGLTPHELTAITPEGQLVFTQPYVEGRGVTQKNLPAALARAGVHFLSDLGATSGVAKLDDGRWVVYDDLHPGNVRTMPGGGVEIIDANNRELDSYEIKDLHTLGKMPLEKPPGPPKGAARKKVQKYANATVIAPMVETHHGTPHDWAPEKKVRHANGTLEWIDMDRPTPSGAVVVERAPEGRVRGEKVGSGEGNAAFGWGVLYSAARRGLAEAYRDQLSKDKGKWLLDGKSLTSPANTMLDDDEFFYLNRALRVTNPDEPIYASIADLRAEAAQRRDMAREQEERPDQVQDVQDLMFPDDTHEKKAQEYDTMAFMLEKYQDRLKYNDKSGNVYTVQLDVNDPELLDWFMPMKDQTHVFDKVAAQFGFTREQVKKAHEENEMLAELANNMQAYASRLETDPEATPGLREEIIKEHADAEARWDKHFRQADTKLGSILNKIERKDSGYGNRSFDGEKFYTWMTDLMGNSPRAASEYMNLAGVPGVVFLDRESRGPRFEFDVRVREGQTETLRFDTQEEAEYARNSRIKSFPNVTPSEIREKPGFNNYVIFDPERIKVVAKNGEVVRTVADDLPVPPQPGTEPLTVAAMEEVKDTDLSVAPMAGQGTHARYPWLRRPEAVKGYKPGGWLTPRAQLSKEVGNFVAQRERQEKAAAYRSESMLKDLERALRQAYGKQGPDKAQNADIQMALGNLDNRLTQTQYDESLKYKDPDARHSFIETAQRENVDAARARQQTALGNLPEVVRKQVNRLRNKLDHEAKELLKDPGLDTELRARVDSEMGVFLHSNSYQHFESDVWGKHIKSDDPEAQRIRRAAEALFKNEIIGEKAHDYQVAQAKLGVTVSDTDALAHAAALPNITQMTENRLAAYLRKDTNDATRMHMLTGKITIPEAGKLLSLNRENLPQEVKELWGQWTDPKINFVKTYTLLANHNADIRTQHSIVEDGTRPETGYIWKPDPNDPHSSPAADLVPLGKPGDTGPLADAYGPQYLKDGLANYSQPQVQNFLVNVNRWALAMKTTGNIASAVHNFFGNIAFSITNGNLPWAVGTFKLGTILEATFQGLKTAAQRELKLGTDEVAELIELGVFDSDIAVGTVRSIYKAAQAGSIVEKKLGLGAGLQAVMKVLQTEGKRAAAGQAGKVLAETKPAQMVRGAVGGIGASFKGVYQGADNFWKYFNYKIELAKQQWIHAGDSSVTLDQMKRNAANMVQDTLPSYSRVPELVRRGLGEESVLKYTGAFFTFQTESARTVVNNITHVGREAVHGKNWKEQSMAAWRLGGMIAMLSLPYALGLAARRMFGYDDDDERALRNSLPEYQKNASMLVMLPRDAKGNPGYVDLSWLNPYGLVHSAGIAASRAGHEGKGIGAAVGAAGWNAIQPLITVQPGVGTVMDIVRNQDSLRGGRQIYSPEDTMTNQIKDMSLRALQGLAPGTAQNIWKAIESAIGHVGPSGREPDPVQDITSGLAGLPRLSNLELDRAMQSHVGTYKKRMGDAVRLLNEVVATKATVGEGEVAAAYKQANQQAQEIFTNMSRAYKQLTDLGMDEAAAVEAMEIGFGTEIQKGGLGKNKIDDVIEGTYLPIELSDKMIEGADEYHPERLEEYERALEEAQRAYDLQNSR